MLDPKYVFEDISGVNGNNEADASQQISSLKKLIDTRKKKAVGYDEADLAKNMLHNTADLSDFFKSADAYEFLTKFNQFNVDNEAAQFFKDHKALKPPVDLQIICDDLKVCGRREMGILIKLRHKYKNIIADAEKAVADVAKAERDAAKEPEDEDDRIDRELEETMKRMEREKKKQAKKEKVLADKSELRKKMSVIATTMLDNDEDLTMSRKLWDDIRKKGFE